MEHPTQPDANEQKENPCLSCGACCAHFRVSFYFGELQGQPGGWVPLELTNKLNDFRAEMKVTDYRNRRCISLRGEVGKPGIHCATYQQRPSPCREYEAWLEDGSPNPDCQRLRVERGLAPLLPRIP